MSDRSTSTGMKFWSRRKSIGLLILGLVLVYVIGAYLVMPHLWKRYAERHPELEDQPGMTYTADGIPADPINVALIGTRAEVLKIMLAAKWFPADPLTLRSSLEIAEASVFKREYEEAPVSSEFLFGRKEDLSFEQAVGLDPRQRHHVRFWRTETTDSDGRPIWLGSAIFDKRVGLSHTTGQITHETAPDIDAERNKLFDDLKGTGDLSEVKIAEGFHKTLEGKNGEGNPWHTDGDLYEGWINPRISSSDSQSQERKP